MEKYFYSFTAPLKVSLSKYFFCTRKIRIVGIAHTTEQANKSPHIVISLKLPLKTASPKGRVLIDSELVIIKGQIKLFHDVINVNIASVVIAGHANGMAILKNN